MLVLSLVYNILLLLLLLQPCYQKKLAIYTTHRLTHHPEAKAPKWLMRLLPLRQAELAECQRHKARSQGPKSLLEVEAR